ncbi:hypothetical protein [Rubrivirga marina]|uniref:Uncharacterized protein n=1 Tax=Rubrivirga marina TaxID=1196024 RepID=A0A271IY80_9BACT|nr:hypothetical protein [Rubrivirga marina]PAP75918.1 hypothetical protein BSZ37_05420 [Rubrivirga marina]
MIAAVPEERAALVVGTGPLAETIAARLAAVAHVAVGATDPAGSAQALAEVERVVSLYGRAEALALAVGRDVPALVRGARELLPDGHAVVLVEPPPIQDLDAVAEATASGTTLVRICRAAAANGPRRRALDGGRVLWTVEIEATPTWAGARGGSTADVAAARQVRELLFPVRAAA